MIEGSHAALARDPGESMLQPVNPLSDRYWKATQHWFEATGDEHGQDLRLAAVTAIGGGTVSRRGWPLGHRWQDCTAVAITSRYVNLSSWTCGMAMLAGSTYWMCSQAAEEGCDLHEQLAFFSLEGEADDSLWETFPALERSEMVTRLSWILVKAAKEDDVQQERTNP